MSAAATAVASAPANEEATTIFERGRPGRRAFSCPPSGVPERPLEELLPGHLRRGEPARLPEVSEPELVRHYVRLSRRNFDLDSGFYPLGSCTMKHNPRLHERVAALAGHARLHPLQDPSRAQGALELMWNLERALSEIAGLPYVCLQPSAGSHGELAGVLLTRAYHESRGEHRTKVLTPDTSHGTNPATVTMAGLEVVKVGTNAAGGVDLDDLRAKADRDVACLMLTNPNTLGVFDENIEEIAQIVHGVGATLYYDGANLNAVMGISRPGDTGFDIVHFNLHKSFTQPHGGGGPGAGPIAVSERIEPFLPRPTIVRHEPAGLSSGSGSGSAFVFDLDEDRPQSIGRLRGFQGNYGCFVRAYAYICSLGAEGLRDASETAVLNANYLLARLRTLGVTELLPPAFGDRCMHEFVLSGAPMKRELGIRTLDLAKRLLDHGVHPPTVYFPLLVEEALLVEPTETETKETLDAFAQSLAEILREAREDPEIARQAPYSTPVRRLDEAAAARSPVIRQAM
jgi:glycine dehydrogenase subunit 2